MGTEGLMMEAGLDVRPRFRAACQRTETLPVDLALPYGPQKLQILWSHIPNGDGIREPQIHLNMIYGQVSRPKYFPGPLPLPLL